MAERVRVYMIEIATMLAVLIMLGGCRNTESAHPIKIAETEQGFLITEGDDQVMFYQRKYKSRDGKYARANYVHPLHGLDGEILTEDFPADHLHHRGVFWAWHQAWLGDKKLGDSWSVRDFVWDIRDVKILTPDSKSRALQVEVYWKSPLLTDASGNQKPFVKELTTIRVHRAEEDVRKVDFQINLLALEDDIRLGGSEDEKGYGGFTTRIPLPEGLSFIGADGPVEPQNLSVEGGPWMDFSGPLGPNGKTSGLAILCHESLPGYPQRWILRRKGSAQNPVFPGREPVPLSQKKPLVLRYRLIIHRGDANHVDLDRLQAEYNSEPPVR
ncbi:MAG: PmoA family protein [Phycisphaerales bacterium]|nr:MAG: PmoA family protein [Phycisphaerales bacterium]